MYAVSTNLMRAYGILVKSFDNTQYTYVLYVHDENENEIRRYCRNFSFQILEDRLFNT